MAAAVAFASLVAPGIRSGFLAPEPHSVPRNPIVVGEELLRYAGAEHIELERVQVREDEPDLYRPTELLDPERTVQTGSQQADVADVVDEQPPQAPRIVHGHFERTGQNGRCSGDSSNRWELVLEVQPPADDHAAPRDLAYAVHVRTEGSDHTKTRLLAPDHPEEPHMLRTQLSYAAPVDEPEPLLVSARAVDLAGNRSEPSEERRVTRSGGCSVSPAAAPLGWLAAALLLFALRTRRRQCG